MLLKVSLKFGFVPCGKGVRCPCFIRMLKTDFFSQLASWIPVDEAAKVIVDIAMSDQPPSFANVVHPRPILVGEVLMWMRDAVIQQKGWEADMLPMLTGPEHLGFLESVENYTNNIDAANIAIVSTFRHRLPYLVAHKCFGAAWAQNDQILPQNRSGQCKYP